MKFAPPPPSLYMEPWAVQHTWGSSAGIASPCSCRRCRRSSSAPITSRCCPLKSSPHATQCVRPPQVARAARGAFHVMGAHERLACVSPLAGALCVFTAVGAGRLAGPALPRTGRGGGGGVVLIFARCAARLL